ncbi:LacI family DNA-binding transcriptional regulator [Komagataeibacter sp. FXV3]|uniref:LacI family DNA-binding transcriptional regulator n=1 Tax=Komagataeibacter sp. FXV3 TaxID=2608998 RepID=UPI00187B902D|nr:LacI family DNA-binding transcriptional regulator [Komagataeibacter sp. FXV3]
MGNTEDDVGAARSGRVRIADIARELGLNPSTVSRAISNPNRVNPETHKLVAQTARRMGYTANHLARSLRTGRTNTLLVAAPSQPGLPISPVVIDVLHGIFFEAGRMGYSVFIRETDPSGMAPTNRRPLSGLADGIISISGTAEIIQSGGLAAEMAHLPLISLLTDQTQLNIPSLIADEAAGLYQAADYLIRQGHVKLAYIAGPLDISEHDRPRYQGFCRRLEESGLLDGHVRIEGGSYDFSSGTRAAETFLDLPDKPTAVIGVSDAVALGFIRRIKDAGLRVPEDVAVIGYDDLAYSAYTSPSLTTISQPTVEIGKAGTRLLIDACSGRFDLKPQLITMPTHLVRRESA